jgi:hypothetical protein
MLTAVLGFQLLVQFLQALELRRESAFARRVYHEDDFALDLAEGKGLAPFVERLEVVDGSCRRHGVAAAAAKCSLVRHAPLPKSPAVMLLRDK